jgi:1-acyl-sn-glycerol-3-phosphate acyltransferase
MEGKKMLRTIFWFICFFGYLLFTLPALRKANKLRNQGKIKEHNKHVERITSDWARFLVKRAGLTIHVHGKENLSQDETYLIVSNHQGNFDIPILMGYLGQKLSFISKVEVKKIPVVPMWMEHMNCIFMDRTNRRQSIEAIYQGAKNLQEGNNVVIFPEGTRSKGEPMGAFKKGSFKIAAKSRTPILPVTIDGSFKAMEANNNLIRPAEVHLTISPPLYNHIENPDMDVAELSELVKSQIETKLSQDLPVELFDPIQEN